MDSSEEEEDEIQSSDNESDSDNDLSSTQKKGKKAKKTKGKKNVASDIVLNTSSQLLEQVTQQTNSQDTLYGKTNTCAINNNVLILKYRQSFNTFKQYGRHCNRMD